MNRNTGLTPRERRRLDSEAGETGLSLIERIERADMEFKLLEPYTRLGIGALRLRVTELEHLLTELHRERVAGHERH